jgi:hypothetical protein
VRSLAKWKLHFAPCGSIGVSPAPEYQLEIN